MMIIGNFQNALNNGYRNLLMRIGWHSLLCSLVTLSAMAGPAVTQPSSPSRERAVAPATSPAIVVTFSGQVVHVAGVTPNGSVAIITAMREPIRNSFIKVTNAQKILTDSAGAGAVDFDLGRPIPLRSIWAVVDISSGLSALATPAGFPLRSFTLPSTLVKNTVTNEEDQIVGNRLLLDILLVRPGKNGGAWLQRTADGGESDEDGKNNGQTLTSMSGFVAVDGGGDRPPKKLKEGDVLLFIDPFEMRAASTAVTK
jgi:hypothetical protein